LNKQRYSNISALLFIEMASSLAIDSEIKKLRLLTLVRQIELQFQCEAQPLLRMSLRLILKLCWKSIKLGQAVSRFLTQKLCKIVTLSCHKQ